MELSKIQKESFLKDGYLVIDTGISESVLNGVIEDLAGVWGGKRPRKVSYVDSNRIQDAWKISKNIKALAISPKILDILTELYDRKPLPFQTLNFLTGTQQKVHADSIHFNSEPFGLMCGVWIALEDIEIHQGPLVYYPGSNQAAEVNFEDLGLEANYANYGEYEDYIESVISEQALEPKYGLVKKGEAIIWSANLLHGGSKQRDSTRTRYSQVTHYYFEGAQCWRPGLGRRRRRYFEPSWIPYAGSGRKVSHYLRIKYFLTALFWSSRLVEKIIP